MPSTISFTLNINIQSSNAHQIRPILPNIVSDNNNTQRTITINKISSSASKKYLHYKGYQRLYENVSYL